MCGLENAFTTLAYVEKTPNVLPSVFPFLSGVPLRLPHWMASPLILFHTSTLTALPGTTNILQFEFTSTVPKRRRPAAPPIASMPPPCYSTLPPSACLSNTFCLISVHGPFPCQSLPNTSQPVLPTPKHIQLLSAPSLGLGYLPFQLTPHSHSPALYVVHPSVPGYSAFGCAVL